MKAKVAEGEQKIISLKNEKKGIMETFNKSQKNKNDDDRFEDVLREEFNNMQTGFEMKIESLAEQILNVKREKGKEVIEMKQILSREIETKNLLMKFAAKLTTH